MASPNASPHRRSGEDDWAGVTTSGVKEDLSFEPKPTVWEDLGRQKDLCMGKNCETYNTCFYFKARRKWFGAHLLIVNHHLFFANVANSGAVLPRFDAAVFDEAQNLEEAATSFLGVEITNSNLFYFLDRLHHPKTKRGVLSRIEHPYVQQVSRQLGVLRRAADTFFNRLLEEFGRKERVLRFYKPPALENNLHAPMEELFESLKTLEGGLNSEEDRMDIGAAANRCFEFNSTLSVFMNQKLEDYVYWLEIVPRKRYPKVALHGVPIDIGREMKEQVFEKIDRLVLTSATLTTQRKFDFINQRIGYAPHEEVLLDSPFDYSSQALLYTPSDLPDPVEEVSNYVEGLAKRSRELIQLSKGKTFILFTSYAVLNQVYEKLENLQQEFQLLRQGDLPPSQMIQRFKETPSIIFGTNSFWQGVDIPGEALRSVIITRLPFDVPSEPIIEARLEYLRKNAIDPFRHYQIPRAIIQMRQGFGRLIRKRTDTGVVSILDSRVVRRGYGKQFLASLPACRVVDKMEEVAQFFRRGQE